MKSLSLENRLPVDVIREVFEYKDGKLFWKRRPLKHFNSTRAQNVFNSKWAGVEAGTLLCPNKEYLISQVSYKGEKHSLLLHIATWAIVNGVYPSQDIDHLDGDGLNNDIHNLSEAGVLLNMQNKRRYKNNSSGLCGVIWYKRSNKWVVQGTVGGKKLNLGYFESFFDAACTRKSWELSYDFTERHGK